MLSDGNGNRRDGFELIIGPVKAHNSCTSYSLTTSEALDVADRDSYGFGRSLDQDLSSLSSVRDEAKNHDQAESRDRHD